MVDAISFYFLNVSFLFLFLKLFGIKKKMFSEPKRKFIFLGKGVEGLRVFCIFEKVTIRSNNGNFLIGI
jgi:hypothetical protein